MQLSEGQLAACKFISDFVMDVNVATSIFIQSNDSRYPDIEFNSNQVMVLSGPAGTGKTTVIKHVLQHMQKVHKAKKALGVTTRIPHMEFCATTNKAAEAFENALNKTIKAEDDDDLGLSSTSYSVKTIHSMMNFVMMEDPKTLKDELVSRRPDKIYENMLIFIDEASYVDFPLLSMIAQKIGKGCKLIFMGDKYQCKTADGTLPVFDSGLPMAELTQIMRQADDNPIQQLTVALRGWVANGGKTPTCPINGTNIVWLDREKFTQAIIADMSRDIWKYETSKVLAYTNKTVNFINKLVYQHIKGTPELQAGDYAMNNSHIPGLKNKCPGIGTDRMVYIQTIEEGKHMGEKGHWVYSDANPKGKVHPQTGNTYMPYFMPEDKKSINKLINRFSKKLKEIEYGDPEYKKLREQFDDVKNRWIDLRPVFAQTIHKAQGSTFRRVFIDLSDLNRCYDKDQLRRLLYVAVSRASHQLVLTGDIP